MAADKRRGPAKRAVAVIKRAAKKARTVAKKAAKKTIRTGPKKK